MDLLNGGLYKLMQGKFCTGCGMFKLYSEFHKHNQTKDGYRSRCKMCRVSETKEYQVSHQEHIKMYRKLYREKNREEINKKDRLYYQNNKHKWAERQEINKERKIEGIHSRILFAVVVRGVGI